MFEGEKYFLFFEDNNKNRINQEGLYFKYAPPENLREFEEGSL